MSELDVDPFERPWFRFGIAIAFVYAGFTVAILWLLTVNMTLALLFAVVVGTVGTIALMIYVLYFFDP